MQLEGWEMEMFERCDVSFSRPPPTPPNKQRKHAGRTSFRNRWSFTGFTLIVLGESSSLGWIFIPYVVFSWVTGPKLPARKILPAGSNQLSHVLFVRFSGWWLQILFIFHPDLWKWSNLSEFLFQMGWFNHQLYSFLVEIICLHGEFQVWFHIFIAIRWGCCTLDNQTNTSLPQSPRLFWLALFWRQWDWLRFWWWQCHGKYLNFKWIWSNYSNLTRPGPPKGSKSVPGNPRLFQGYLAWWNIMNHLARWMVANGPTQVKGEIFDELFLLKGDTIWFFVYKYVRKNIWNPSFWVCVSLALVVKCCKLKTIYCKDLKLWVEWLVFFAIPDFASSLILAKSQRSLVNRQI